MATPLTPKLQIPEPPVGVINNDSLQRLTDITPRNPSGSEPPVSGKAERNSRITPRSEPPLELEHNVQGLCPGGYVRQS